MRKLVIKIFEDLFGRGNVNISIEMKDKDQLTFESNFPGPAHGSCIA